MNTFGTNFIVVSDVIQPMDSSLPFGPWIHLATIKRGFNEYIVFKQATTHKVYIERVIRHMANLKLEAIADDNEWSDIVAFCNNAGILGPSIDKEFKIVI